MSAFERECACEPSWASDDDDFGYHCRGNSQDCPVRTIRKLHSQRTVTPEKDTTPGTSSSCVAAKGMVVVGRKRDPASES